MEKILEKIQKEALARTKKHYSFNKNDIEIGVECLPVKINCITEVIERGTSNVKFNAEVDGIRYVYDGNFCFINENEEKNVCLWYGMVSAKNKLLDKYSVGEEIEGFMYFPINGYANSDDSEIVNNYDPNKFYATFAADKTLIELNDENIPIIKVGKYTVSELEEIKPEDLMFVYVYVKKKEV